MNMPASIFLLFLLLISTSVRSARKGGYYNHFQWVQTWPNTFCLNASVNCKTPVPQHFTLHGLWPADRDGRTLLGCNSKNVSSVFSKYKNDLQTAWPSIRSNVNEVTFWQHEWNQHGSCVEPRMTPTDYFQLIIGLRNKIDLLATLSSGNIRPSNSGFYSKTAIESAIKRAIGHNNVYISCYDYRGTKLLKEIFVCLDTNANSYISCPNNPSWRGCGGRKQKKIKFA